jgi:hypothetical protein
MIGTVGPWHWTRKDPLLLPSYTKAVRQHQDLTFRPAGVYGGVEGVILWRPLTPSSLLSSKLQFLRMPRPPCTQFVTLSLVTRA